MSITSRACRRPSPSSRRRPRAIRARRSAPSPRSTTICACLFARVGVPYSPATGLPIESQTVSQMADRILALPEGTRLFLLAPIVRGRKGEYRKELAELQKKGFQRVKIDGKFYEIAETPALDKKLKHDIEVVVDRIVVKADIGNRLPDSIETALGLDRRPRDRRIRRQEGRQGRARAADDVVEIRLPGLRLHHSGNRAAPVQLQQSAWRLPHLRRAGHPALFRCRPRRARRKHHLAQGRRRALGEIDLALLPADAGGARPPLQILAQRGVGRPAEEGARRHPVRLGRRRNQIHL